MVVETARNCSDGNDTVVRYALEAPAESFFLAPTNIVNDRTAEFTVPIAESSHSVCVVKFNRFGVVLTSREVGSNDAGALPQFFESIVRFRPDGFKLVVVNVEMSEGIVGNALFDIAVSEQLIGRRRGSAGAFGDVMYLLREKFFTAL